MLNAEQKTDLKQKGKKLTSNEERAKGSIGGLAYMQYIWAGGICLAFFMALIQALGRTSEIMSAFWLALWAEETLEATQAGNPFTALENTFYLRIYALFGFLGIFRLGF